MREKLSGKNWFIIVLFCFVGGIAWNTENMYFNTFLYNSVYADASKAAMEGALAPTTAVSRMVALSAVAAVLTTFVMGTLSDKLKNRKLFISVGYILWGIVTGMFGFITKDNQAVGPFGVMGAFMQPQGHLQTALKVIEYHQNPQAALDAPRWYWTGGKTVQLEHGVPLYIARALEQMGHDVQYSIDRSPFGRGQMIIRTEQGTLAAGTDPRCDGAAAAY